jgi:sarcosine oxidase
MSREFDLVVVGAGIVGLSTALCAAQAGLRVACIDSQGIANFANASSDESRLFRVSYYEHPSYVPLLLKAIDAWHSLAEGLLIQCGGFYAGPIESELIDGSLKSAIQNGLDHDFISHAEAKQRFPQFSLPDNYWGVFERDAGYVRSYDASLKMASSCIEWGVRFICSEVVGLNSTHSRWCVSTTESAYIGDRVVVAAGNATGKLVPAVAPFLRSEPHLLHWYVTDKSVDWDSAPGFGIMDENNAMLYGFPSGIGIPGVKVGGHQSVTTDSQLDLTNRFLRGISGDICAVRTCNYDRSPDGHFMIGEVEPGLSVACGMSGHGFKFGSVIGHLVMNPRPGLEFLSVDRYLIRS